MTIWYIDSGAFRASSAAPIFGPVESGCVTIEPAQPAAQDMLIAYGVPTVIATVVIVGLPLLVLQARNKKRRHEIPTTSHS